MAYCNGYIQRKADGYVGELTIDGVDISPIVAVFFRDDYGKRWLWLKRKKITEYDFENEVFYKREPSPAWEVYMEKLTSKEKIAYRGEFIFFKFKYRITAIWDDVFKDKERLNFFVDRLPYQEQSIIRNIIKAKSYGAKNKSL